jgi:hypothetical protein
LEEDTALCLLSLPIPPSLPSSFLAEVIFLELRKRTRKGKEASLEKYTL